MATSPLAPFRNRLIFAACWLLWIAVQYQTLLEFQIDPAIALTDACLSNTLLAAMLALTIYILGLYRPQKKKYLFLLVWCLALSGLWAVIVKISLANLFDDQPDYLLFLAKSMPIRFDITFLVAGCAAITSMLWYSQEEQKQQESRKRYAEKLERDAELYKLRQQLQPHFLFNSLNSISALTVSQPEQARKMIQRLSEFLRGALKKEDQQWVTLADELQHLQLYLEMEQMRFGHRLSTEIVHDEKSPAFLLPPMLLQPLVENAIKFGLYDTTDHAVIRIKASVDRDLLTISVENPFDPATASPKQGAGFGLSSVQRRLYLLFARNDLLSASAENNTFLTILKIPRHDQGHPDR